MNYPKIPSYTLPLLTAVMLSVLYVNKHFAHADDLKKSEIKSQVNDWSIEQSLNYLQQSQIKNEIRQENRMAEPDTITIQDLKETQNTLKLRSIRIQELKDLMIVNPLTK